MICCSMNRLRHSHRCGMFSHDNNAAPSQPPQPTACAAAPRHQVQEQYKTATMDIGVRGSTGHSLLHHHPANVKADTSLGEPPAFTRCISRMVGLVPTLCRTQSGATLLSKCHPTSCMQLLFPCASFKSSVSICKAEEVTGKEFVFLLLSDKAQDWVSARQGVSYPVATLIFESLNTLCDRQSLSTKITHHW